jgi:hypothetical protein
MKKLFTLSLGVLFTFCVFGQIPKKLNYQCVIRDAGGALVTNHNVGMRITIFAGSANGTVVYQETYNPVPHTNANGLVTLEIGSGVPVTGIFANIAWEMGLFFLKTETDPTGGTNYTITGTSQFLPVPFALAAKFADEIDLNTVVSDNIVDGSVLSVDLANNSVTSVKIADGTISASDLSAGSVNATQIADNAVGTSELAAGSVTLPKINTTGAEYGDALIYNGTAPVWDPPMGAVLGVFSIPVDCSTGVASFGTTPVKVGNDLGAITKRIAASSLVVTYYGRINVDALTGSGAIFELRVDNTATTYGRAKTVIKYTEVGNIGIGIPITFSGVFPHLSAGYHTFSMWVYTTNGTGTNAYYEPGCFHTDNLIIQEIKDF